MPLRIGIIGLPNVGKSTLFNALSKAGAEVSNYPFTTIEPNIGVVPVPDKRFDALCTLMKPPKKIFATIDFVDIAGLVKGASKGEGLGNKFLANIREADALAHVVRCFGDEGIVHVEGIIDPVHDIETINSELLLADLATVEKKWEELKKASKADKKAEQLLPVLSKVKDFIEKGTLISSVDFTEEESDSVKNLSLLTSKSQLIVANISEDKVSSFESDFPALSKYCKSQDLEISLIPARLESEVNDLPADEAAQYLESLGIKESAIGELSAKCNKMLDLISFFTSNEKECRAWTLEKGLTALDAAGRIHTDIAKGFIGAEVISVEELIKAGSLSRARETGSLRLEGRDYIVRDGDHMFFKFRN